MLSQAAFGRVQKKAAGGFRAFRPNGSENLFSCVIHGKAGRTGHVRIKRRRLQILRNITEHFDTIMEQTADKRTQIIASPRIPSAILRLAGPAIVSMVVMAIYNMADTYFVGLVSDTDLEVAAISVFLPVLLITQAVSVLFASGGAAYLSRLLGEDNLPLAGTTATTTVLLTFLSGVVVMIVGVSAARPIMLAVGASSATVDMAVEYAVVMFAASPIQLTNMSFNNLLRAEGNAVRSMVGIVTGAVLNIVLDPIFISWFGWGVAGAAWATAIAQSVSFVILGSAYWAGKTTAKIRLRHFRFLGDVVKYILKVGLSTFLVQAFTAIGFTVINIYTKPYGDGAIAAVGIVNRLQFLGFAVMFGFSQGFQPVCGYNFGADRFSLLRRTLVFGIVVAMLLGVVLVVFFELTGNVLIGMFAKEEQVIALGVTVLDWFTVAYPLTAFSLIMMSTYQALGRAVGATVIAVCRQGVCMIPTVMVLAPIMGFDGIVVTPLVSDIVSSVIAAVLAVRIFRYIREQRTARMAL